MPRTPVKKKRRGTPRDTSAANAARRDPLGRKGKMIHLLATPEEHECLRNLTGAEAGDIFQAAYEQQGHQDAAPAELKHSRPQIVTTPEVHDWLETLSLRERGELITQAYNEAHQQD